MGSLISLFNEKMKKPILISLLDVSKFFDSELLKDAINAQHSADMKRKLYINVFMLNKDT